MTAQRRSATFGAEACRMTVIQPMSAVRTRSSKAAGLHPAKPFHPECGGAGVGSLLMARCHEMARGLGYTRVIHALMHEDNKSRKISSHSARPIRRYTLFARPLG